MVVDTKGAKAINMLEKNPTTKEQRSGVSLSRRPSTFKSIVVTCFVLCLNIALFQSINPLSITRRSSNKGDTLSSRNSETCGENLPYSSYLRFDDLCKLCTSYLRDYPEVYEECR